MAKGSKSIDWISLALVAVCTVQLVLPLRHMTVNEYAALCTLNPLLGGAAGTPGEHHGLPLFTYLVGHIVPGIAFELAGAVLVALCTREWAYADREDERALLTTIVTMMGSAPLLAPMQKMLFEGTFGRLYFDLDTYPLWWAAVSLLFALVVTESWFYWIHRLLHIPFLYRWVHGVHHSFTPSTAACAAAFHPLDIAILTTGTFLTALLPIHYMVHSMFLLVNLVYTIYQHTATRTSFGFGIFNDPNLHCIHHDYGMKPVNLGSILCVWDRLCGTYVSEPPPWAQLTATARKRTKEK